MSDLAELTGFAQRYAEAWRSLVTSLISGYELWKIDNGAGGSRTTWTGGPGSRPGWSAVGEQGAAMRCEVAAPQSLSLGKTIDAQLVASAVSLSPEDI